MPDPALPRLVPLFVSLMATTMFARAGELSEDGYFAALPTVLTVTRLAQPIVDTPGAVTIIDRETIRRSGAREISELLRLVPGYLEGGANGAHPFVAYHAPLDVHGARNLVLVDGRSVYSSYYLGGTGRGMMGVLLEDVERIEVLRGSNSAAYGANALFGVVNIITRNAADAQGAEVSATLGEAGIRDGYARIGWGDPTGSFRLSAGRRSDHGYLNAHDDKRIDQAHLRGDFTPSIDTQYSLHAGFVDQSAGDGFPLGSPHNTRGANPLRSRDHQSYYLDGQFIRFLSDTDEIKLQASLDGEMVTDAFPYAAAPSVFISYNGKGQRLNLEAQHQMGLGSQLRAVWGLGFKRESVRSSPIYARDQWIHASETRLFGNLEWQPHRRLSLNASGFMGNHSRVGSYFAPRLMANLKIARNHVLRLGANRSARTPTLLELASDIRYYPSPADAASLIAAGQPLYALLASNNMPVRLQKSSGNVAPEWLSAQEVGYFGHYRPIRLTVDVRGFVERMSGRIVDGVPSYLPGYNLPVAPFSPIPVSDFGNSDGFTIRGLEYQLRWKPTATTELWLNQTFLRLVWDAQKSDKLTHQPPRRATTLALFQQLPREFDLAFIVHAQTPMTWGSADQTLPAQLRVDARLARRFQAGATRGEAALAIQAANGHQATHLKRYDFAFERRAYATLRFEY